MTLQSQLSSCIGSVSIVSAYSSSMEPYGTVAVWLLLNKHLLYSQLKRWVINHLYLCFKEKASCRKKTLLLVENTMHCVCCHFWQGAIWRRRIMFRFCPFFWLAPPWLKSSEFIVGSTVCCGFLENCYGILLQSYICAVLCWSVWLWLFV